MVLPNPPLFPAGTNPDTNRRSIKVIASGGVTTPFEGMVFGTSAGGSPDPNDLGVYVYNNNAPSTAGVDELIIEVCHTATA